MSLQTHRSLIEDDLSLGTKFLSMSSFEALQADQSGATPSINTENDVQSFESALPVETEGEKEKLPWSVGDIVWSKIPGHPWWPSLVANEPNTEVYFKVKGRTKYYHVQFFGTEALRGWVTERNVLKYQGIVHCISLQIFLNIPRAFSNIHFLNTSLFIYCSESRY